MDLRDCEIDDRRLDVTRIGGQWMRFGNQMAVLSDAAEAGRSAAPPGVRENERYKDVDPEWLYVVAQKGRLFQIEQPEIPVLLDAGRYLLVQIKDRRQADEIADHIEPCYSLMPWNSETEVFSRRTPSAARTTVPAWVTSLVDQLSEPLYESVLGPLVGFRTRHSLHPDFQQAASWASQRLQNLGFDVIDEPITVHGSPSQNVVARRVGNENDASIVYIVAHLDSINSLGGADADAPGADDNASGSAGVLALAEVLSDHSSVGELRVVLFGGEEQGLFGSKQHLANLSATERARIAAVINMDMIGTMNTLEPTVLLEGASLSQAMIDGLAESASQFTSLQVQTSLNPFASDHVPFINAGIPAVLTIEAADSSNQSIHTANDTPDKIDVQFAVEVLRMNLGYIADTLGNADET